jgi:hypothetical protein
MALRQDQPVNLNETCTTKMDPIYSASNSNVSNLNHYQVNKDGNNYQINLQNDKYAKSDFIYQEDIKM